MNSSIGVIHLSKRIYLVSSMKRAILLQICATKSKEDTLRRSLLIATSEFNRLWDERDFCNTFMDFHKKVYLDTKKRPLLIRRLSAILNVLFGEARANERLLP